MDNQNQNLKLNRELSGSKRRSRLKLDIATLPNSGSFAGSNGSLGDACRIASKDATFHRIGESMQKRGMQKKEMGEKGLTPPPQNVHTDSAKIPPFDYVAPAHPVRYLGNQPLPTLKEKKDIGV